MAIANTGSRNGLITWAVTATVLGVGSLIWAVVSYTQANKAQTDLETTRRQYAQVATNADLANLEEMRTLRGEDSTLLLPYFRRTTGELGTLIGGSAPDDARRVTTEAQAALETAKAEAGNEAGIDTSTLLAGIRSLTAHVRSMKQNNVQLAQQLEQAQAAVVAAQEEKGQLEAVTNEKVELATRQAAEAQANAAEYSKAQDEQVASALAEAARKTEEGIRGSDDLTGQLNALRQQFAQLRRENDDLKARLQEFRVPVDQIVQQADGQITRTGGPDRVFINLGKGDQVAAGMTFEVYDRLGVPRVGTENPADDKLLKGKASIEVVRTQPGISECRIVRLSPGAAITEGDPIVNVVYDKNVKFNFYVFGRFNLDYKGVATERDTDVIRRLISGWGANVADQLNSKTDFVILGEEPVVPNYTQDELAREPEKAFEKEQAEQALEQYINVRTQANQLNIPLLNQTRFLYMVGYYEEAAR